MDSKEYLVHDSANKLNVYPLAMAVKHSALLRNKH
jgi:hypothetical protein